MLGTIGELISNVLLWTPTHGHTSVDRLAKTYIHQLYADTGCCLEDLLRAMADRDRWQDRIKKNYHDDDDMTLL